MALHLLERNREAGLKLAEILEKAMQNIGRCQQCRDLTELEVCTICANPRRDQSLLCIVESPVDVLAIEQATAYGGRYFVLLGRLSPLDGIGPADLEIDSLVERIEKNEITEVIMALSTTMEGDTTNFYIYRKLKDKEVKLSTLARGVSIGDELEYTDEITLGRSITNRVPYESSVGK